MKFFKTIIRLLKPRLFSLKNENYSKTSGGWTRPLTLAGIGLVFWLGLLAISLKMLLYFKSTPGIGDLLAYKLLSMILITAFSLLIFSSVLTTLSRLYLSRDLMLVHSLPVSSHNLFFARWLDATVESSWMVNLYTLPVFIAYGIAFKAGGDFYLITVLAILFLSVIASGVSAVGVMAAVLIVPARRMKSVFIFLGLLAFILLFVAFRLLRPEQLVNPEAFGKLISYVNMLNTAAPAWLPSTWSYDAMKWSLVGNQGRAWFHLGISGGAMVLLAGGITGLAAWLYFPGVSKSQTAGASLFKPISRNSPLVGYLPGPVRALLIKEIKSFFRDQSQWSQLFLIAVLIAIYVYNFRVLPLHKLPIGTFYLQNIVAFLNIGLALFVLTAIAARFVYPAVSMEGPAFWILKAAPLSFKRLLWIKFCIYFPPLMVFCQILVISTNILLHVPAWMMGLSVGTVCCVSPGIVALGVGLGAAYPDFGAENPAQSFTSFGGILFMLLSGGFAAGVILLEAGPVYAILMAHFRGISLEGLNILWILICFALAALLCLLAVIWPMRFGQRRLTAILHGN